MKMRDISRTEIANYVVEKLERLTSQKRKEFHQTGRINSFIVDDVLPKLIALQIYNAFPKKEIHTVWGGLLVTLFIVWVIMTVYGTLLLYGLFIQPRHLKNLLLVFSKWRIFGGTRKKIKQAAFEIEERSENNC